MDELTKDGGKERGTRNGEGEKARRRRYIPSCSAALVAPSSFLQWVYAMETRGLVGRPGPVDLDLVDTMMIQLLLLGV